jgi:hypothetical protein
VDSCHNFSSGSFQNAADVSRALFSFFLKGLYFLFRDFSGRQYREFSHEHCRELRLEGFLMVDNVMS